VASWAAPQTRGDVGERGFGGGDVNTHGRVTEPIDHPATRCAVRSRATTAQCGARRSRPVYQSEWLRCNLQIRPGRPLDCPHRDQPPRVELQFLLCCLEQPPVRPRLNETEPCRFAGNPAVSARDIAAGGSFWEWTGWGTESGVTGPKAGQSQVCAQPGRAAGREGYKIYR
jgi:hypothetical protein